jgi:hypothetical protein
MRDGQFIQVENDSNFDSSGATFNQNFALKSKL